MNILLAFALLGWYLTALTLTIVDIIKTVKEMQNNGKETP